MKPCGRVPRTLQGTPGGRPAPGTTDTTRNPWWEPMAGHYGHKEPLGGSPGPGTTDARNPLVGAQGPRTQGTPWWEPRNHGRKEPLGGSPGGRVARQGRSQPIDYQGGRKFRQVSCDSCPDALTSVPDWVKTFLPCNPPFWDSDSFNFKCHMVASWHPNRCNHGRGSVSVGRCRATERFSLCLRLGQRR